MAHSIKYIGSTRKDIDSLPQALHERVVKKIEKLAVNPRPDGCKKLKGRDAYRIRVGEYRIVYEVRDDILFIYVVRVAHRSKVYE